ncbi:MAG: aminopeptidase [Clostridia bacterium]|jgi:aminopeptidase|nr:aminopeptidase [Clostridia bacterium]MBT7121793.1 aminopeptidase [Clostridia bacterium]
MIDQRLIKLCKSLVSYSMNVQKGDKVLIENFDCPDELSTQLIKEVYAVGGIPYHISRSISVRRALLQNATKEQIADMTRYDSLRMQDMDAYVAFRGSNNNSELSDVNEDNMTLFQSTYSKQVHLDLRVAKTKWVILRYPNGSMAQLAGKSTEQFEDFYFDVCNLDYAKMGKAMEVLQKRMKSVDNVHIVAKDTDITFSIKDIPSNKCAGDRNVPDGEVYTAPVKTSVNGVITYNTPSFLQGFKFENVRLEFKDGKIIKATANDNDRINKILDTDEGARYIGEFAMGVNPYIQNPMCDTLFDEKIAGSIHLTPGACYEEADNGNQSAVHWDLVQIHRPEYGGGEIYFDDELVRKDGVFLGELDVLNEDNLK